MKLAVRADDFGYTEEFNRGTMTAVENGIVTTVDLMLDTPGTIDAMEKIREYPWISVGWHGGHCWGRPVADPAAVSSLLNEEGRFKYWNDASKKNDVDFHEALIECRAEVERCIQILGKAPVCTEVNPDDSFYEKARAEVCDEFGIRRSYMRKKNRKTGIFPILLKNMHHWAFTCRYSTNPYTGLSMQKHLKTD